MKSLILLAILVLALSLRLSPEHLDTAYTEDELVTLINLAQTAGVAEDMIEFTKELVELKDGDLTYEQMMLFETPFTLFLGPRKTAWLANRDL